MVRQQTRDKPLDKKEHDRVDKHISKIENCILYPWVVELLSSKVSR